MGSLRVGEGVFPRLGWVGNRAPEGVLGEGIVPADQQFPLIPRPGTGLAVALLAPAAGSAPTPPVTPGAIPVARLSSPALMLFTGRTLRALHVPLWLVTGGFVRSGGIGGRLAWLAVSIAASPCITAPTASPVACATSRPVGTGIDTGGRCGQVVGDAAGGAGGAVAVVPGPGIGGG